MNRAEDWLRQAERDLHQAQISQHNEVHEWACFAAQQAAEKAVEALHFQLGQNVWGHSVLKLLRQLPEVVEVPRELEEFASVLDAYYIPPRYPNGFAEGAPYEYYTRKQSEEAVRYAREILEFTRAQMARCRDRT
ncbi:MAG: HEPN domain-containing protein [Armatimonadota bacterium]|nr:HEPN domain-containing protein [bacterium]MDW8290265.1 HEPN domain-containing protein [Armatimonadota bacterium]